MLKQKLHQADADERTYNRTDRTDDMELLIAAAEIDVTCAEWLFDHRTQAGWSAS